MADKAYDSDALRLSLKQQGTEAVIPYLRHRRKPPPFDAIAYRRRNVIERTFCRLKDWRAIATRYDKTARNYLSGLSLVVAVSLWIR